MPAMPIEQVLRIEKVKGEDKHYLIHVYGFDMPETCETMDIHIDRDKGCRVVFDCFAWLTTEKG